MVANDLTEGKHIDYEEEGAEDRTLGDTMGDWRGVGFMVIDGDEVVTIGEIRGEPEECSARYPY